MDLFLAGPPTTAPGVSPGKHCLCWDPKDEGLNGLSLYPSVALVLISWIINCKMCYHYRNHWQANTNIVSWRGTTKQTFRGSENGTGRLPARCPQTRPRAKLTCPAFVNVLPSIPKFAFRAIFISICRHISMKWKDFKRCGLSSWKFLPGAGIPHFFLTG